LQRFDGVIIAQNDFSYRFNARLTRRLWRVAVEAQVNSQSLLPHHIENKKRNISE